MLTGEKSFFVLLLVKMKSFCQHFLKGRQRDWREREKIMTKTDNSWREAAPPISCPPTHLTAQAHTNFFCSCKFSWVSTLAFWVLHWKYNTAFPGKLHKFKCILSVFTGTHEMLMFLPPIWLRIGTFSLKAPLHNIYERCERLNNSVWCQLVLLNSLRINTLQLCTDLELVVYVSALSLVLNIMCW